MEVKKGVVYLTSTEGALPKQRHSLKRLQMLSTLTKSGDIAYQENGIVTVYIPDQQLLASFETQDHSFKIYSVVIDTEKYVEYDQQAINEYCIYKINFHREYRLNVFSSEITRQFEGCISNIKKRTRAGLSQSCLLLELYQLRKHAQDLIVSKTLDHNKVEAQLREHLQAFS